MAKRKRKRLPQNIKTATESLADENKELMRRGPKTDKGLAKVSRNAITHGLYSNITVIEEIGETEEHWLVHRDGVVGDLNPVGYLETTLAEDAARLLWRLRRVARFEDEATRIMGENCMSIPANMDPFNDPFQLIRLAVLPGNARLEKVIRAETHLRRSLSRTLKELRHMQEARGHEVTAFLLGALAMKCENYKTNSKAYIEPNN